MERDFSANSRQKMISMVSEIENEKWNDVTDFIGDRWYDFESWIGLLNIRRYLNDVSAYHKKLIDRKNYSVQEIETIFDEVNRVADRYTVSLVALLSSLKKYKNNIQLLSETVNPANGRFSSQHINDVVKKSIDDFTREAAVVDKLVSEGYDEKDFENLDSKAFRNTFSQMVDSWLPYLPNGKVQKKIEIPIGPNLSLYYDVAIKGDLGSSVDVEAVADENKLKFKDFKIVGFDSKAKIDEEGIQELSHDFGVFETTTTREGIEFTVNAFERGNTSYSMTYKFNAKDFVFEEEVSTKVEGGEVISKIGLKKENQDLPLKPVAVPEVNEGTAWDLVKIIISIGGNNIDIPDPLGFAAEIKSILRELSAHNRSSLNDVSIGAGIGLTAMPVAFLIPCLVF